MELLCETTGEDLLLGQEGNEEQMPDINDLTTDDHQDATQSNMEYVPNQRILLVLRVN